MLATILTIGDELLIGQVVDTNSAWIAQELNKIGLQVQQRISVGDNWNDIWNALETAEQKTQVVLITGGLGPTADDITKPLLCKYFNGKMVVDEWTLTWVKSIFVKLNRPMIDRNLKQAEVPDTCTVIKNHMGTAPGMWFTKNNCIFVSMPGVPFEMKAMMTTTVLPKLQESLTLPHIEHRTLLVAGIGESFLAELLKDFEDQLPTYIKMAYLPNLGMLRLRLTAINNLKEIAIAEIDKQFEKLKILVKDNLVIDKDEPLQQVVANLLITKNKTLSTAESCTGGYLSHLFTNIPGASAFFYGSVVSYHNSIKQQVLQVQAQTLQTDGAVSEATVTQMVAGSLQQLKTDYTIAISGILGPTGGTPEKPVGTVWIAVGNNQKTVTQKFLFRFDRSRNMGLTATSALNMLRMFILEN